MRKRNGAKQVGIFDLKTHASELVGRVERGETVIITRYGTPVARLVPFARERDVEDALAAEEALSRFARGNRLPRGVTLRDLIDEGRR